MVAHTVVHRGSVVSLRYMLAHALGGKKNKNQNKQKAGNNVWSEGGGGGEKHFLAWTGADQTVADNKILRGHVLRFNFALQLFRVDVLLFTIILKYEYDE